MRINADLKHEVLEPPPESVTLVVHFMEDTTIGLGDTPHPVMMVEILRPVEIGFESPGWAKLRN